MGPARTRETGDLDDLRHPADYRIDAANQLGTIIDR